MWIKLLIDYFFMFMINLLSCILFLILRLFRAATLNLTLRSIEPQSSGRPRMRVYPQVSKLVAQSSERATKLAHESKPLFKVIPIRRKVFPVPDEPDFASPRFLYPDCAHISNNKNVPKTNVSAATFADLEKVERCSRMLVAGHSQSYWLLPALLSQLKQDGFRPSDPALFDKNMSALSAYFATQTSICVGLTDFVTAKRRESFFAHAPFPVSELQKRELLVSLGSDLFDHPLLKKVSSQMKEDSISSSLSLSKLSKSSGHSKSSQSSSQLYSSLLEYTHPGSFGYRKRSASPLRVPLPSGVVVAGACLLLRTLVRVSTSRSHVPVH